MGVSGGVWECGKPERFSIISMPQSEGEKGEVTFSLRPLFIFFFCFFICYKSHLYYSS